MIFDTDQPIDDMFLDLVKRMKKLIKENPKVQWVKDRDTWVLTSEHWVSEPVSISYHWIDKNKFEVFTEGHVFGTFRTAKDAVDSLALLGFMEKGVSNEVVKFLANKARNPYVSMQEAVDSIVKETDIIVSTSEMHILGINNEQRGAVHGRQFGI
jgi:hypothetical protein